MEMFTGFSGITSSMIHLDCLRKLHTFLTVSRQNQSNKG